MKTKNELCETITAKDAAKFVRDNVYSVIGKDAVVIGTYRNNKSKQDTGVIVKEKSGSFRKEEVWITFNESEMIKKHVTNGKVIGFVISTEDDEYVQVFDKPEPVYPKI